MPHLNGDETNLQVWGGEGRNFIAALASFQFYSLPQVAVQWDLEVESVGSRSKDSLYYVPSKKKKKKTTLVMWE